MVDQSRSEVSDAQYREERVATARALVSEIWMLIDFVAGSPDKRLERISVGNPTEQGKTYTPPQFIDRLCTIELKLEISHDVICDDRAFLQFLRDALNSETSPVAGLTVAYSSMVAGPYRTKKASRVTLAERAYEKLRWTAKLHNSLIIVLILFGLGVTGFAVWESSKVALGRALLDNMASLRKEQAALTAEAFRIDAMQSTSEAGRKTDDLLAGVVAPITSYRLCDRSKVRYIRALNIAPESFKPDSVKIPLAYGTPEERDVCGRDDILRSNIDLVHGDLATFSTNWSSMIGSAFSVGHSALCLVVGCSAPDPAQPPETRDIEFRVAAVLLVWGNLLLPIVFGFIGSTVAVLLDYYNKIKASLLHPNDRYLEGIQLVMGMIVGACVGLFYSAMTPAAQSATPAPGTVLLSSLTLTASGVAFLAGFGVDAVFAMLQALLGRVFSNRADAIK